MPADRWLPPDPAERIRQKNPRWLRKLTKKAQEAGVPEESRFEFARFKHARDRVIDAHYTTVTVAGGAFTLVMWGGVRVGTIDGRFYQTAASIIPLLTLTLAIQERFFSSRSRLVHGFSELSVWVRGWGYQLLGLLVAGEIASLYVLTGSSAGSKFTFALTVAGLVGGGVALVIAPLIRTAPEEEDWAADYLDDLHGRAREAAERVRETRESSDRPGDPEGLHDQIVTPGCDAGKP